MTSSIETGLTLPLIGHLYDYTGASFKQSFKLLNTPDFSLAMNGQGASSLTLELGASLTGGNAAPAKGDIITLTEDGGDGSVIFKGIVEDFPDERGTHTAHAILVNPIGVQLGDTPFVTNYTVATDAGQIARDIVNATASLTWDATSIPLVGSASIIFDFSGQGYTCLTALDELRKMAGVNYYFWPDTAGKVWFKAAAVAGPADHSIMVAPQTEARKYSAPVANRKNIIHAYGAVLSGATAPLLRTYDNSAGSPLGKRILTPDLTYSKATDPTTLQNIANTVGSILDREHVTVELEVINYATRIQPGDALRYFEETVNERTESGTGSGAYSPIYIVLSAKQNGPRQSVVASDIPTTLNDLKYMIDAMIARTASAVAGAVVAGTPGAISPVMIGPTLPATPAAPTLGTAVERTGQNDNADVTVTWLANAPGDYVSTYTVRWRKGSGPYLYVPAGGGSLTVTIHGLTPGVSYGFSVAAVNALGNIGAYSAEATIVAASDSAAPATPTGLAATKTPRGALVSWNGNTEADLQGYELQVSIGGAGYVSVTPGATLVTSLAYVAPSGTALGTSLAFQVRSLDWSGNLSAWSAASAAVNTDGIVYDELQAGNVKVYGTLTTGGLQTGTSGKRLVLDGTSLRLYDGSSTAYGAPSGVGVTVELDAQGGAFFQGTVSASKVYASTVATSATMGATGAPAGFKLSADSATPYLDFFTAGSTIAGSRFFYAKDGTSPFGLAGVLAANVMTFALGAADSVSETMTTTGTPIIADAVAIATFKPSGTAALRGSVGAFLSTNGGSISPAFGQATAAGNLLVAWVNANTATPPSITTAASGWVKAIASYASHVEATLWYKANSGAGETAPTFTATLVAPSAADSTTDTITTGGTLSANVNNAVTASFTPASSTTPIALVKAGGFTIGGAGSVSPAFGQPTAAGNLLVATIAGQIGTSGGATADLGADVGTSTYNWSGVHSDNVVFMGPYTMPQHGTITSLNVFMGGHTASVGTWIILWDSTGAIAASVNITAAIGRALQTVTVSKDAPSGSVWYVGFWRDPLKDAEWGVRNTGSFKFLSDVASPGANTGYSNSAGSIYISGDLEAYAVYSIVGPGTDITTTATGWVKAVQALNTLEESQIWYKPNSGAAESAPIFTSAYGTEEIYAQLAEFSGVATSSPLDKVGSFLQTTAGAAMTVAGSTADTQSGNLVITATRWVMTGAATATFVSTENNASPVDLGNSGGSSLKARHGDFSYAIVPVPAMHAQLAEFSGVATSSPLDKTGSTNQTSSVASILAVASAVDGQAGNLILTSGRWQQTGNSTASWLDSINNATAVNAGSSGASSLSQHSNFAYGIIAGSTTGEVLQLSSFVGLEAQTTDNSNGRGFISTQYSTDATGASFIGRKARGAVGAPTTIANLDQIYAHWAQAYDGTNWLNTARLTFDVNGAVSSGNIPTDFNIRLNPGTGEYIAASFKSAGGLLVAPSKGGSFAASSYGSVPVKIAENTAGGATITFSSIPSGFRHLLLQMNVRSTHAVAYDEMRITFNSDTGATQYAWERISSFGATTQAIENLGSTAAGALFVTGTSAPAGAPSENEMLILNYASTAYLKAYRLTWGLYIHTAWPPVSGTMLTGLNHGYWNSTAAINRIDIIILGGYSFDSNSVFTLYGIP